MALRALDSGGCQCCTPWIGYFGFAQHLTSFLEEISMAERPFNPGEPLAYFLTWTTYGTWLLGDERGWWRKGELQSPSQFLRKMTTTKMEEPAFELTSKASCFLP